MLSTIFCITIDVTWCVYNVGISEKDVTPITTNYVGLWVFINNSWSKTKSLFMFAYLENESILCLNWPSESNLFMFTHTHNTKWTIKQDFQDGSCVWEQTHKHETRFKYI